MARMNVSIEDDLLAELRRWVPVKQRSRFISAALEARLDQLRQESAVLAAAGAWEDEGRGDAGLEVRRSREGWDRRVSSNLEGDG